MIDNGNEISSGTTKQRGLDGLLRKIEWEGELRDGVEKCKIGGVQEWMKKEPQDEGHRWMQK